ncbi:helix-turn-helix domain-containing protein [Euryhalocaulis caribicus]|uniref:helix-turn-helix domain-containing protein n=1 Tax=Euryhalocaulis caribicus TaxID=1161401 RepID=UPI0003A8946E|nr:helix-turn-helix transcriptional regulator [Euryhalocaulis caribicus]
MNVRRLRKERGLSQEALGHEADVDRTYVSGIERCVRNPTIDIVERIAKALEVDEADLFRRI